VDGGSPEEALDAVEQVRGRFRGQHNVTGFYRVAYDCPERFHRIYPELEEEPDEK